VHRFEVEQGSSDDVLRIAVDCSSGTYVRVLAADLGRALGGGAHLRNLRRTAIGSFTLDEARPLEHLDPAHALPAAAALRDYPSLVVGAEAAGAVAHGRPLDVEPPGPGPYAVLDGSGALLAVYEGRRPSVVVSAQ
jgi:tRNA pseudouridine55 synthase